MSLKPQAGMQTREVVVIAIATTLFVAVFAVRLAIRESDIEVLLLCALPIAILAVEFGLVGGLLGAAAAAVLLALYVGFVDYKGGPLRYATRVAVFAALAVLVAALAEALRRLSLANELVGRESEARSEAERQSAELARLAEERRLLAAEVIAAEEEARRRIAEDLHDGALQTLLAAKQDLIEASPGRTGVIRASEGLSEGIDGLRRTVGALQPVTIEHDGLASAVGAVAAEAERRGDFQCDLRVEDEASGLHDDVLLALTRELLANASKHSGAGRVFVSISRNRDWLQLKVTDDGCGFDAAQQRAVPCDGHIGLACAERRARALGGGLEIAEGAEGGTAVSARIRADVAQSQTLPPLPAAAPSAHADLNEPERSHPPN